MNNGQESIAEEVYYLSQLAGVGCDEFAHQLYTTKIQFLANGVAQVIASFTVPQNSLFICTFIGLRTFPTYNDAQLVAAGGGDYRSDDLDVNGTAQAWLRVNAATIMPITAVPFAFTNRPVFFLFPADRLVELVATKVNATQPNIEEVHTTFHGYIVSIDLLNKINKQATRLQVSYS